MRTRPDARLILLLLPFAFVVGGIVWVAKLFGLVEF